MKVFFTFNSFVAYDHEGLGAEARHLRKAEAPRSAPTSTRRIGNEGVLCLQFLCGL